MMGRLATEAGGQVTSRPLRQSPHLHFGVLNSSPRIVEITDTQVLCQHQTPPTFPCWQRPPIHLHPHGRAVSDSGSHPGLA